MVKVNSKLLLSALIFFMAACSDSDNSDTVKIGVLLGAQYDWQNEIRNGIEKFINEDKSDSKCIHPKKLKLIYKDTLSTQEGATQSARELVNYDNVDLLLGPNISDTVLPASFIAENAKIPMLSITSSHSALTQDKEYVFQFVVHNQIQAKALSEYLFNKLAYHKGAVIFRLASDYSRGLSDEFGKYYSLLGGKIVEQYGFADISSIPEEVFTKLKKDAPSFVFLPNFTKDVILLAEQLKQHGIDTVLVGTDSWDVAQVEAHTSMDGSVVIDHWHNNSQISPSGTKQLARHISPLTVDAMAIVWQAICSSPVTNADSIVEYFENLRDFEGNTGKVHRFNKGVAIRDLVVLKIKDKRAKVQGSISVEELIE